jgi:hypothetical protein
VEATDSNKLHYGPIAAFFVTLTSFFGSQFLAGIAIALIPLLLGWDKARVVSWLDSGLLPQVLVISLSAVITVSFLHWYLKISGDSFKKLGLGKVQLSMFGKAILGFLVYLAAYLVVVSLVKAFVPGLDLEQKQELGFDFSNRENLPLLVVSLVVIPPFLEELVMRGFLFGGLRTRLNFANATILTSVLFAAAHLPEGSGGPLWVGAIDTFVLSVVLCYLREKTGSLWSSIFVHALKNGVALVYLVYLS